MQLVSPVHIRVEGLYGAGKGQALHLDQRRASLVQLQARPRAANTIIEALKYSASLLQ